VSCVSYLHICSLCHIFISCLCVISCLFEHMPVTTSCHGNTLSQQHLAASMGWLRLVGSLKLKVSFAKEPYKTDYILQKRPIILRSLLIELKPIPEALPKCLVRHILISCLCVISCHSNTLPQLPEAPPQCFVRHIFISCLCVISCLIVCRV